MSGPHKGKLSDPYTLSATGYFQPVFGTFDLTGAMTGMRVGDLTHTRANHTATLLSNGWILVLGGYEVITGGTVPVTEAEMWIPSSIVSN